MNLVKAVSRRAGVRVKNITYLEIRPDAERIKVRVNDRIEYHPEPKDFQIHRTDLNMLYSNHLQVSGDISVWPSLLLHLEKISPYQETTDVVNTLDDFTRRIEEAKGNKVEQMKVWEDMMSFNEKLTSLMERIPPPKQ